MKFVVEGTFTVGKDIRPFTKELEAISESRARELVLTKIGADHHIGRSRIKISSVERMENAKQ